MHFADGQVILSMDEMDIPYMLRKLQETDTTLCLGITVKKRGHIAVGYGGKDFELSQRLQLRGECRNGPSNPPTTWNLWNG